MNPLPSVGTTSTVSSTSSSGNEDYGNGNSNGEGTSFTPVTSCTTSSSSGIESSGYGNFIDNLLGGLGLRKRSQDPCKSSAPLPPTPSPSPSESSEPCPDDTGAPAPSSGNESSSGDDIVADLSPLAEADVNLGSGLNEATTGVAAGLGLGKVIYPGRLASGKREEDCDCEDGHGSAVSSTWPAPSSTPSAGTGSGLTGSGSTCPSGAGSAPLSGSPSENDIVADLSPLAKADVNVGPGLDSAVTGLVAGLGLGKVIYPGHLVNGKREEGCDGNGSSGSSGSASLSAPPPPLPSSASPTSSTPQPSPTSPTSPTSPPLPTSPPSSSEGAQPCPNEYSGAPSSENGSPADVIVADLSPLVKADADLGPGLNDAATGLSGGLGLGKVVYPGELTNEKREEDCDCGDGSGSHPQPPASTSSTGNGSGSGLSSACPSGTGSSNAPSGSDIVADLSPLAEADANLGPGLDSAVTGLAAGLGLGRVIYPGQLVNAREEDCDGNGSAGSTTATPPPPPPPPPAPSQPSPSKGDEPCPDESGAAPSSGNGSSSGSDIVANLSPLTEADANLGPGLNSAVTGLAGGLGLGKVIYPGQLVNNGKREEDCDCEDGSGSSTSHPQPPTSTSSAGNGSGSGSSSSTCPSGASSGDAPSSSDIVVDLSPLAEADANLGPGLNSAITGLAAGLGLGKVIYPGQLVNTKRD
ncbi:hypothetical protein GGU10DRAFT_12326 [Lentinula aff. detonsa]|uniref:Uncharacterized protein n=1 Tax=Lentinula aff. detonsa TaxID=2804958 RepID=A0AA38NJ48_9AGAR|nr:hypothetical protein GGU10DRAFT_12326 [Lentinula aff. detonsa]